MKTLKTTLLALLLAASQWALGQSGSNCPDALPQTVQAPTLAVFDTLTFPTTSSELWLEFQAPSLGQGVVIDYRMKPGSGGTDVIGIEVYLQVGGCANLQLVASKSLAIDSTVLVELDSTLANAFYSVKLIKNSGDIRNNDIIGLIRQQIYFGLCWNNLSTGATGLCYLYGPNGGPGNVAFYGPCVITVCPGETVCFDGFQSGQQTSNGIGCNPLSGNVNTNWDAYWWAPGSDEAINSGNNNQPNLSSTGFGSQCFTYNVPGFYDIDYNLTPLSQPTPTNYYRVEVINGGTGDASFTLTNTTICLSQGQTPIPPNATTDILFTGSTFTQNEVIVSDGTTTFGPMTINYFNTVFNFPSAGTYTITVNATSNASCQTSDSQTQTVEVIEALEIMANVICDQVTLSSEGCYIPFGSNPYFWDMGNGVSFNTQNVTYTYPQGGNYTITLSVGNLTETINVTVFDPITAPEITTENYTKCCTSAAIYEVDPIYVSYIWDIGTFGTISAGQGTNSITVNWDGQAPGSYVYVTVVDANGCEATAELYIDRCCSYTGTIAANQNVFETDHCGPMLLSTFIQTIITYSNLVNPITPFNGSVSSAAITTTDIIMINNELIADVTFTFNNCPNIVFAPSAKITMNDNIKLSFVSTGGQPLYKTFLRAKCDQPWDGIYNQYPNSDLIFTRANVRDAENVIVSSDGGDYEVTNTVFENNQIGIYVKKSNATTINHQGFIWNSTIQTNLSITNLFPNRGKYGILIQNIDNITIGANTSVNPFNTFKNLDFGIHTTNSNVNIYRNIFNNIDLFDNTFSKGIAIFATTSKGQLLRTVRVGDGTVSNNNVFNDCGLGVMARGHYNLIAKTNDMYRMLFGGIVCTQFSFVGSSITIQDNKIRTVDLAALGIYLQHVPNAISKIINNEINLVNPTKRTLYGIGVENFAGAGFTGSVEISNNKVKQSGTGVYINNIPNVLVKTNNISYGINPPQGNSASIYGIYATNSSNSKIEQNTVTRQSGNPNPNFNNIGLVGIHAENSPQIRIFENTITGWGKGIQPRANNSNSQMYCNKLQNNYNGIHLNFAIVGNQGVNIPLLNTVVDQDNKWTGNVNFRISGNGQLPSTWIYRPGNSFNLNIPNFNPMSITPILLNGQSLCTPGGGVLNPSPLKSFEREQKFGEIVADTRFYTTFEEVSKYTDRMYLIENLYRDSTWLATNHPDDSVYVGYYNQEMSKNCGKVVQITKDVENNDYTAMAARNTSLNDSCSFTAKIKEVNNLFLNYWANDVYTFSSADEQFLHDLACSDAIDNGPAVYNARALLGLYVPCNNGFVKSAQEETEDITISASPYYATVYPNPAQNIAYLEYDLADATQAEFVLYDITGKEIQKIRLTDAEGSVTLPLENLNQGVYLYRIMSNKETLVTGKLIINP